MSPGHHIELILPDIIQWRKKRGHNATKLIKKKNSIAFVTSLLSLLVFVTKKKGRGKAN